MKCSVIKNYICRLSLILLLAAILLPAGDCWPQERRSKGRILPKYYPANFSGHGCINRIEGNEVVIDDRLYRLTTDTTYHTPKTQYATSSQFRKGVRVGFIQNAGKKIESLWYISKCR